MSKLIEDGKVLQDAVASATPEILASGAVVIPPGFSRLFGVGVGAAVLGIAGTLAVLKFKQIRDAKKLEADEAE